MAESKACAAILWLLGTWFVAVALAERAMIIRRFSASTDPSALAGSSETACLMALLRARRSEVKSWYSKRRDPAFITQTENPFCGIRLRIFAAISRAV